jgi:hypothetical protein
VKKWIVVFLAVFFSLSAAAQESDMKSMPGYVDFGVLDSVYGEPRVRINIGATLLKFMAAMSREDPEAAALMSNLEGVRINIYSTAGQMKPAQEQIARIKEILNKESWEPIVQVRENDEEVQIFINVDETGMQGLTVMTVDAEEAVFINILGEMDPSKLGVVLKQLNTDVDIDAEDEQ